MSEHISIGSGDTEIEAALSADAAYAEMVIAASAGTLTLGSIELWSQIDAGWAADQTRNVTVDADEGTMTVITAGQYATILALAFTSDADPQIVEIGMFRNGELIPDHLAVTWTDTQVFPNTVPVTGIDAFEAGDVLDVRARSTTSGTIALDVTNANLSIFKIA